MTVTAPDLNASFPRAGRELLGRYTWLGRLADKVRADHAGTAGEYIAYCGLSTGFLDRAGVEIQRPGQVEIVSIEKNEVLAARGSGAFVAANIGAEIFLVLNQANLVSILLQDSGGPVR